MPFLPFSACPFFSLPSLSSFLPPFPAGSRAISACFSYAKPKSKVSALLFRPNNNCFANNIFRLRQSEYNAPLPDIYNDSKKSSVRRSSIAPADAFSFFSFCFFRCGRIHACTLNFLIASYVSRLIKCSILQASASAVALSTPSLTRKAVSTLCFSNICSA